MLSLQANISVSKRLESTRNMQDIFECIECKVKLKSSLMSDHLARVYSVSINDQSHASKGWGHFAYFLTFFANSRWKFIPYQFETYPWKAKSISNRSNWTCFICNTSFKLKKQLIEHEKAQYQVIQQNTYAYQSKVCAKSFRRPYLLREYEQIHEKKTLFGCQLCPAKYRYVLVTQEQSC